MAMNRGRNDEVKDQAAFDRLEQTRLEAEGLNLGEALQVIAAVLGYVERGQPVDWLVVDRTRYKAAKRELDSFLKSIDEIRERMTRRAP